MATLRRYGSMLNEEAAQKPRAAESKGRSMGGPSPANKPVKKSVWGGMAKADAKKKKSY